MTDDGLNLFDDLPTSPEAGREAERASFESEIHAAAPQPVLSPLAPAGASIPPPAGAPSRAVQTREQAYRAFLGEVEEALLQVEAEDADNSALARPVFRLDSDEKVEWFARRLRELAGARATLRAQYESMDRDLQGHLGALSNRFKDELEVWHQVKLKLQRGKRTKTVKTLSGDIRKRWLAPHPKLVSRPAAALWAQDHDDLAEPKWGAIRYVLDGRKLLAHVKATGETADGVDMIDGRDHLYLVWREKDPRTGEARTQTIPITKLSELALPAPDVDAEDERDDDGEQNEEE